MEAADEDNVEKIHVVKKDDFKEVVWAKGVYSALVESTGPILIQKHCKLCSSIYLCPTRRPQVMLHPFC